MNPLYLVWANKKAELPVAEVGKIVGTDLRQDAERWYQEHYFGFMKLRCVLAIQMELLS